MPVEIGRLDDDAIRGIDLAGDGDADPLDGSVLRQDWADGFFERGENRGRAATSVGASFRFGK